MLMSKLNIYHLCSVLTSKNGLDDKESHRFIKAMFDVIQEGLDEDKIVKVKGLGTFKIIEVDDRESITHGINHVGHHSLRRHLTVSGALS